MIHITYETEFDKKRNRVFLLLTNTTTIGMNFIVDFIDVRITHELNKARGDLC